MRILRLSNSSSILKIRPTWRFWNCDQFSVWHILTGWTIMFCTKCLSAVSTSTLLLVITVIYCFRFEIIILCQWSERNGARINTCVTSLNYKFTKLRFCTQGSEWSKSKFNDKIFTIFNVVTILVNLLNSVLRYNHFIISWEFEHREWRAKIWGHTCQKLLWENVKN